MVYAFVDGNGIAVNRIAYDPAEPHGPVTPPEGCTLQQINDWVMEGQNINTPQPTPVVDTLGIAHDLLEDADITMARVQEAIVLGLTTWTATDVVAFVNYRRSLRQIVSAGGTGTLPTKPAYPAGT